MHIQTPDRTSRLTKRTIQKGCREYLFCEECEQIFSRYERVFCESWRGSGRLNGPFEVGKPVVLDNVDYHTTKLLILSVLWRSSVSEEFSTGVQLGPYAEKLRAILIKGEYVPPDHYPVLVKLILDTNGMPATGSVANPVHLKNERFHLYFMLFMGCEWLVFMSDHGVPKPFDDLKEYFQEGQLHLIPVGYTGSLYMKEFMKRIIADEGL